MVRGLKGLCKPMEVPAVQVPGEGAAKCTCRVSGVRDVTSWIQCWVASDLVVPCGVITERGSWARSSSAKKAVESDGLHESGGVRENEVGLNRVTRRTFGYCGGILEIGSRVIQMNGDEDATPIVKGGVVIRWYRGCIRQMQGYKYNWVASPYVETFGDANCPKVIYTQGGASYKS